MTSIAIELKRAVAILAASGVAEPVREAASLMAFALKRDRVFLIAHQDYDPTPEEMRIFDAALERRSRREPLQYIVGKKEFYGLDFVVSPNVLIPRPETESLVEQAVAELSGIEKPRFCEIGIGSGCIAISVLAKLSKATAVGVDISQDALVTASLNAERHNVSGRLRLLKSDVFAAVPVEKFDAILSNPPYVPESAIAHLQAEVRDFEPLIALTDGGNGFGIIRKIIRGAPVFLNEAGVLLIEIGFNQAENVLALFDPAVWREATAKADLQGIPRTILARLA